MTLGPQQEPDEADRHTDHSGSREERVWIGVELEGDRPYGCDLHDYEYSEYSKCTKEDDSDYYGQKAPLRCRIVAIEIVI